MTAYPVALGPGPRGLRASARETKRPGMYGMMSPMTSVPTSPALDWRSHARMIGRGSGALPLADAGLGGFCLLVALCTLTLPAAYGMNGVYLLNLVLCLVIAGGQPLRRRALRASALITAAALAAYSALTFVSPVSLGVTPLCLTALTSLHAVIRWDPEPRLGRLALALAFLGCLVNPLTMLWLGHNPMVNRIVQVRGTLEKATGLATVTLVCVLAVLLVAADAWRRRHRALEHDQDVAFARHRAAQEERLAISRELHDILGHGLTAIKVRTSTALALDDPALMRATLAEVERTSAASLEEVRDLVLTLRTEGERSQPSADLTAIHTALVQARVTGLVLSAEVPEAEELSRLGEDWSALTRLALLRAVQEGLTNAIRHGGGQAEVTLYVAEGQARLLLSNNLPAASRACGDDRPGSGLDGLNERIRLSGGVMNAGARVTPQGRRFVLDVALPITRARTPAPDRATAPPQEIA